MFFDFFILILIIAYKKTNVNIGMKKFLFFCTRRGAEKYLILAHVMARGAEFGKCD